MYRLIVSLFLSFLSLAPLGNAYAVTNIYSFEDGTTYPFTINPGSGLVLVTDWQASNSSRLYLATDGNYFLELSAGDLVTAVSSTFTDVIPGTMISFDWAFLARDYVYRFPKSPQNDYASVTINGKEFLLSDVASVGDFGDTEWQTFSFLAPSETVSISFSVTNIKRPDNPSELLVDNLRINQTAPVPEPKVWAMLLVGLGLVARRAGLRRRPPRDRCDLRKPNHAGIAGRGSAA